MTKFNTGTDVSASSSVSMQFNLRLSFAGDDEIDGLADAISKCIIETVNSRTEWRESLVERQVMGRFHSETIHYDFS